MALPPPREIWHNGGRGGAGASSQLLVVRALVQFSAVPCHAMPCHTSFGFLYLFFCFGPTEKISKLNTWPCRPLRKHGTTGAVVQALVQFSAVPSCHISFDFLYLFWANRRNFQLKIPSVSGVKKIAPISGMYGSLGKHPQRRPSRGAGHRATSAPWCLGCAGALG